MLEKANENRSPSFGEVFAGIENVGKTAQVNLLRNYYLH